MKTMVTRIFSLLVLLFLSSSVVSAKRTYVQKIDSIVSVSRFRVSVDGGLAYLIASTKNAKSQMSGYGISDLESDRYYREFKLGEQYGASVHYMINPRYGLGVDYSLFTTGSSVMGFVDSQDVVNRYYGIFSEQVYTNYIGLSYLQVRNLSSKWSYYGKLSVGISLYRNESMMIIAPILITGNSPAIMGFSGINYSFSKHVSAGICISDFFSVLTKIRVDDGTNINEVKLEGELKENLSRFSLTTGIQIHF